MDAIYVGKSPNRGKYLIEVDATLLNALTYEQHWIADFEAGDHVPLAPCAIKMIDNAATVNALDAVIESFERRKIESIRKQAA